MWKRLLWALGLCVGGLLATEGVLQLVMEPVRHGYPPGLFVPRDDADFGLAPDFRGVMAVAGREREVRTNAAGFRDETAETPAGASILVLGDSLTFGHGVRGGEAFPAVLEAQLGAAGRACDVVNTGVPAYATHHQVAVARASLAHETPQAVVLAFYVGNDIGGNHLRRFGRLVAESGGLVRATRHEPPWTQRARAWLVVHSRVAQLLGQAFASWTRADPMTLRELRCARAEWDPTFQLAVLRRVWDPVAEEAFAETTAQLDALAALCDASGVPLLVALLPGPYQYVEGTLDKALAACALAPADYDPTRPNRELVKWGRSRGVEVLDLLPVFRQALARRPDQRLNLDVHLSEVGHVLVAEALLAALTD